MKPIQNSDIKLNFHVYLYLLLYYYTSTYLQVTSFKRVTTKTTQ